MKTKKQRTLIEAIHEAPAERLSVREAEAASAEAVEGPDTRSDTVSVGGRAWPITFLPWGPERRFVRIIGPYLRFLTDAWIAGGDTWLACLTAAIVESETDLTELALIILQHYDATIDEAWLNENAHMEELIELVSVQLDKNRLADSLGKLWGRGVLPQSLTSELTPSTPQTMPDSMPPSSDSASDTSSTRPSS